jgi:hypothetical protein
MVEVQFLDKETGEPKTVYTRHIRGRDIIDFWNAYNKWEQELIDDERREEREKKEREAKLHQDAAEIKQAFSLMTGCPIESISVQVTPYLSNPDARLGPIKVKITQEVKDWLGISDSSTDEEVTLFGSEWEKLDL